MLAARRLTCWSGWKSSSSRNDECVAAKALELDVECDEMDVEQSRFRPQ